jgi:hypothetical protein
MNFYVWGSEQAITHIWSDVEIWINKQPCKGVNLTNMTYVHPRTCHVWQSFATTSQGRSRSHLSLVQVFHAIPHTALSVGGPYTVLLNISSGMVGYCPTTTIIEQRQFIGSHKASMQSIQFKYLLKVPLQTVLSRHRRGLPPWGLEYPQSTPQGSHPKILHFLLVSPPSLKFKSSSKTLPISFLNH